MSDPWILAQALEKGDQGAPSNIEVLESTLDHLNIEDWLSATARFVGSFARDPVVVGRDPQDHLQYVGNVSQTPGLNWLAVYRHLDYEEFSIQSQDGLVVLVHCWRSVQQDAFPVQAFLQRWQNTQGQFSVLREIISSPSSLLNFNNGSHMQIIGNADLEYLTEKSKAFATRCMKEPSNSLDLLQGIVDLVDVQSETQTHANLLLNRLTQKEPELLCLGLSSIQSSQNPIIQRQRMRLVDMFLDGHENSDLVFCLLWQRSSSMLLESFLDRYRRDPLSVSQILDLIQESKILSQVLRSKPYFFILDLASLAARRDFLNLEKWIDSSIDMHGEGFIGASLEFWKQKLNSELSRRKDNTSVVSVAVSVDVVSSFLRALSRRDSIKAFSGLFEQVKGLCSQLFPNEMNATDNAAVDDSMFSPEIEEEVKQYFERLYNDEIAVEQIAVLLQRFKDSKTPKEQQIFACMVHTLLDEVRYFGNYPQKELSSTARLFGLLVQLHLVSYNSLRAALKHVLDSVQQAPDSKLYAFGIIALSQFVSRVPEWPQYAVQLSQVESIKRIHPKLALSIEKALRTSDAGHSETASTSLFSQGSSGAITNSSAIDKSGSVLQNDADQRDASHLDVAGIPYDVPTQQIQDRVSFIINNISQGNLKNKTDELCEVLNESNFRWFSQYLVVRRVSIEPNYHQLYMQLLDSLDNQQLNDCILNETYANIKILLKSEKTVQLSSERALLKNLGSWLGALTLAKDIAIRQNDLSFQDLLIEGYDGACLVVVIPFVCKVLEQARHSSVFRPPNAWTMNVIKLLLELYLHADLKLNLKFEIEVMLNALKLNIEDVEPSSILENRFPKESPQGYAAQSNKPQKEDSPAAAEVTGILDPSRITQYLFFNPALAIFNGQNAIKMSIANIVSEVLREIGEPVIARSSSVAALSTKELICKDFTSEPDENSLRAAGDAMVRNLAGNLAIVTSKEPVRSSLVENIQAELVLHGMAAGDAKEIALIFVSDNLDTVCAFVEKASVDKACDELDVHLAPSYAIRRRYRESMTGTPFYDNTVMGRLPPQIVLPEILKPTRALSAEQRKVYNWITNPQGKNKQDSEPQAYSAPARASVDQNTANVQTNARNRSASKCDQMLSKIAGYISYLESQHLTEVPAGHDLTLFIRQLPGFIASSPDQATLIMSLSQKAVNALYGSQTPLQRDCYSSLLHVLCQAFPKILKELNSWITYSNDERKYDAQAVLSLIKNGVVPLKGLDVQLAQPIENNDAKAIEFCIGIIQHGLLQEQPLFSTHDFVVTIALLDDAAPSREALSSARGVIDELKKSVHDPLSNVTSLDDVWSYHRLFAEWIRLFDHPLASDKVYQAFIDKINQDVSQDDRVLFIRLAIEYAVKHYVSFRGKAGLSKQYATSPIDAFAKLVEQMILHETSSNDEDNNSAKVVLGTQILSIIVLCLAQRHEVEQEKFSQKPFLRMLSGVMMNVCRMDAPGIEPPLLVALGNTLYTLQPCYFPGFAFGWLQLMSHRSFMPRLLQLGKSKGWPLYHKLILALLTFLAPILQNGRLQRAGRTFYRGTLRTLLVLLHDFPEFLCAYYWSICDAIPSTCVQLRNLILSAFPRNMYLPDPYSLNLKMGDLFESQQIPDIGSPQPLLATAGLMGALNELAQNDDVQSFSELLLIRIQNPENEYQDQDNKSFSRFNTSVINAVILHIGSTDINENRVVAQSHAYQICTFLLARLDAEDLFEAIDDSQVKERITRVLLDRLIVHRPHPWGLLVTFIELIKSNNFWSNSFTRCSPEIERLFQSVARQVL
ncbi:CCR4-NOT core subunit cdc39 [Umbelopsis nana]